MRRRARRRQVPGLAVEVDAVGADRRLTLPQHRLARVDEVLATRRRCYAFRVHVDGFFVGQQARRARALGRRVPAPAAAATDLTVPLAEIDSVSRPTSTCRAVSETCSSESRERPSGVFASSTRRSRSTSYWISAASADRSPSSNDAPPSNTAERTASSARRSCNERPPGPARRLAGAPLAILHVLGEPQVRERARRPVHGIELSRGHLLPFRLALGQIHHDPVAPRRALDLARRVERQLQHAAAEPAAAAARAQASRPPGRRRSARRAAASRRPRRTAGPCRGRSCSRATRRPSRWSCPRSSTRLTRCSSSDSRATTRSDAIVWFCRTTVACFSSDSTCCTRSSVAEPAWNCMALASSVSPGSNRTSGLASRLSISLLVS